MPRAKGEAAALRRLLRQPLPFLALGFGSGLAPKAPGTFGTLVGLPFYWWWQDWPLEAYLLVVAVALVVGIYLCGETARRLGVHDHPAIVWDEMVGLWITLAPAPAGGLWWLLGFGLFRLFDIWKPWPIGAIDRRLQGGLGIMLDDVLAGLYAALAVVAAAAVYEVVG
ncbi:MAG TPA: phosphatidylglycerophosphatase A [Gammaproteobacteria bacterium]|nr:phosphatidylglycerophosphatase A [Gammaproteobacteria bacterium]